MPHNTFAAQSSVMKILRVLAWLEGVSLILLFFVAMPLKYIFNMPEAVQTVGMAHGILFIGYAVWLLIIGIQKKWSLLVIAISFFAAFVPFGTFWAAKRYFKEPPQDPEYNFR